VHGIFVSDMASLDERLKPPRGPQPPAGERVPAGDGSSAQNMPPHAVQRNLPTWRRIEALREKRALKAALADIWSDDPDVDEVLFGPEYDDGFYISPDDVDEETLLQEAGFKVDGS